jgi:hypothetical protein
LRPNPHDWIDCRDEDADRGAGLDGVAVIDDCKRSVLQVSRGDVVLGLGRVKTVERRARTCAVVTKLGVVVP